MRCSSRIYRSGCKHSKQKKFVNIYLLGALLTSGTALTKPHKNRRVYVYMCIYIYIYIYIGGRDSPHEVFDPWVRWDLGLDRIRSFRVVVVVVVAAAAVVVC